MPLPSCGVNSLITLRSGAEVSLSWDALGRPESMALTLVSGAPQTRSTTYDARGRLQSRTVNGQMTAYGYAEPGWLTEELSHDSAGLLTSQQVYDYDDAGNRTSHESFDGSGVLESARFFTYGTGNRLLSVDGAALTWDDLGGVTEDPQGTTIHRFPDGRAAMVGTPADPSGLLDVLGEPVTLPGSSVALEVVRAADGLPARLYDGSPTLHTRVWGKEEGPWPLSGDSEGVW